MAPVFDYRLPSPALRGHVRLLQIVGCSFPASVPVLPAKAYWPRAENCLSFFPRDPEKIEYGFDGQLFESPCTRLCGQHTLVTNRHVGRDFMVFQVVFQPGALHNLTGIPAAELTNTFLDAEMVFGAEIRMVSERLRNAAHYTAMIPIVEEFLNTLIRRSKPPVRPRLDQISHYLLHHPAQVSLDWLADQACLSQRQFYRLFVERHGVSPKLFARIARFEQAMFLKNAYPRHDWLSVALALGYHDYQHLVRDFRQFTSLTPTAFSRYDDQAPERTFGRVETSDFYHL